jgi:hypothetical protein
MTAPNTTATAALRSGICIDIPCCVSLTLQLAMCWLIAPTSFRGSAAALNSP